MLTRKSSNIVSECTSEQVVEKTIRRGYAKTIPFIWKNPDGTPINLTGYDAMFTIATDYLENEGIVVKEITTTAEGDDVITITNSEGRVEVEISADTSSELETDETYIWELRLVDSSSQPRRSVVGTFTVQPTIFS